jgi:putative membrane protein
MGAGGWVLMALFWVALVALIAWAVVRLFPSRAENQTHAHRPGDEPGEILDGRLAGGEIDIPTYQQLRATLGPHPLARKG